MNLHWANIAVIGGWNTALGRTTEPQFCQVYVTSIASETMRLRKGIVFRLKPINEQTVGDGVCERVALRPLTRIEGKRNSTYLSIWKSIHVPVYSSSRSLNILFPQFCSTLDTVFHRLETCYGLYQNAHKFPRRGGRVTFCFSSNKRNADQHTSRMCCFDSKLFDRCLYGICTGRSGI